ncbi:hypothetical protein [Polyangium sorediatum]|uniref:Uncharacterized protein n=1 Tax=Polyangium sorediatum TaxID=889274 RepID=A0ABT6NJ01_9BACT|nr:hypothetical protein [Polyangium sorediatum]MDI1428289.1 hypothetical protein [Polyangium sorediatum]
MRHARQPLRSPNGLTFRVKPFIVPAKEESGMNERADWYYHRRG